MALIPKDTYPNQTNTTDPNYPQGKARNVTVVGDGTGTPLEALWVNDLWGFLQALLGAAALTPSGSPDRVGASQYLEALRYLTRNVNGSVAIDGALSATSFGFTGEGTIGGALLVVGDVQLFANLIAQGNLAANGNLSVAGTATIGGKLTLNAKIDGSSGTVVVDNNLNVEGSIIGPCRFGGATQYPTIRSTATSLTLTAGVAYIAQHSAAANWHLPASAPEGSWIEVACDHGVTDVLTLDGFPAGLAFNLSDDATGPSGNGRYRFLLARWVDGAWHRGPMGF